MKSYTTVLSITIEGPERIEPLQTLVEQALADGVLSRQEREEIFAAALGSNTISEKSVTLWRQIQEQIWRGEIQIDD